MLIPIILSGGAGTRLWPVSRQSRPKPFMCVGGTKSLLMQTYERALLVSGNAQPLIVTNRDYYSLSRDELLSQQVQPQYLLEPVGRNTAPAVALAALWAQQHGDPCLLVMPADHLITKVEAFNTAVQQAQALAADGCMVLFGIRPTAPETGFGYIEMGAAVGAHAQAVQRFVEKPDAATAERYLAQGNYAWNSGMFCFKASTILAAMQAHCPTLLAAARAVFDKSVVAADGERVELVEEFAGVENISIDYAVMEKADNIAVIAGDFGWSDIGAWNAVAAATPADANGNTINCKSDAADTIAIDTRNTHIESQGRVVATIGLDDMLIIDTPDALLVAEKSRSQEVKQIVARLKANDVQSWGTDMVLQQGQGFKIKRIVVKPGNALSLQMHAHRSEHWVVVSGTAQIDDGHNSVILQAGQSTAIPSGHKYRVINTGDAELMMIEVQCGSCLGEDDVVRYDDASGRTE